MGAVGGGKHNSFTGHLFGGVREGRITKIKAGNYFAITLGSQ
jgi:hypothetical protein